VPTDSSSSSSSSLSPPLSFPSYLTTYWDAIRSGRRLVASRHGMVQTLQQAFNLGVREKGVKSYEGMGQKGEKEREKERGTKVQTLHQAIFLN